MPAPATLAPLYDERYFKENYLASRAARLAHFRSLWARVAPLAPASLPGAPGRGRLLDVGCGPGFFLEVAAEHGWEAWGVEPSMAAEHVARSLRAHVIRAPFGQDHLAHGSFDVVTFWDVLAHLPDAAPALERAGRLLRGGGLLVVKTPRLSPALVAAARLLGRRGRALLHVPQQVYHFTPAALRALCEAAGFEAPATSRVREVSRPVPPAPTLRRTLARFLARGAERLLNPHPSLLLVARRRLAAGGLPQVAGG